jgi:hypothetical protein
MFNWSAYCWRVCNWKEKKEQLKVRKSTLEDVEDDMEEKIYKKENKKNIN